MIPGNKFSPPGDETCVYTLKDYKGHGGYGEVWSATGPAGEAVALKIIHTKDENGKPYLDAALLEQRGVEIVSQNPHDHLLRIFRWWFHFTDGDPAYLIIVMELAEKSLEGLLKESFRNTLPGIPRDTLVEYFRQAALGLDYLHELDMVHRDVKPGNILLVRSLDGQGDRAVVADFSLTRPDQPVATKTDNLRPAPFKAPECFDGKRGSVLADQWSLAAAYCWLRNSGKPLFDVPLEEYRTVVLRDDPNLLFLTEEERPAVAKALCRDPSHRFEDCTEFVRQLTSDIRSHKEAKMSHTPDQQSDDIPKGGRAPRPPGRGPAWGTPSPNAPGRSRKDQAGALAPWLLAASVVLMLIGCAALLWTVLGVGRNGGTPEAYSGVPLGAMIPYFGAGKEAPKGYVWADGQTNWPDEDWVPAKLRDRSGENKGKVPDMREQLVGGAKDEGSVGGVFRDGQITVKEFKITGSNFSVPVTSARMADHGFIFNWQNFDGFHMEIKPEADKPIPPSLLQVGDSNGHGFFMRFDPIRATYDKPQGTVAGDQTFKALKSEPLNSSATNPRHIMCRWIIRVK